MDLVIVLIFILIYFLTVLLSATELVPMSLAALCGGLLIAWFGLQYRVFTYEDALTFIDMRLLGLIIGTMIVVEIAEKSGLFRFAALHAVKLSRGNLDGSLSLYVSSLLLFRCFLATPQQCC